MKKIKKVRLFQLAAMSTIFTSISLVSCSSVAAYQWSKIDQYGIPIPKNVKDLHLYLSFIPNEEGVKSTSANVAANAINNADLNEKMNQLLSFAQPKGDFIPDDFTYDAKAKINTTDPNSLDITVTATEKSGGEKADIMFNLKGFKDAITLTNEQKDIINDNILEVNGLRYLIDGFDISKLSDSERRNRSNAFRWSRTILSKYEENLFPNNPLANFFYASTFDNGIRRINFDNDFKLLSIRALNTLTAKHIDNQVKLFNDRLATLDQAKPEEKITFDTITNNIKKLQDLKAEINRKSTSVNNRTSLEDLDKLFKEIVQMLLSETDLSFVSISKKFEELMKVNVQRAQTFITTSILNKEEQDKLLKLITETNMAIEQFKTLTTPQAANTAILNYFEKGSELFLRTYIARNFVNVLSVKNAEFNAITGAQSLIYKKETQVKKNAETDAIEDEGYSDAPNVRIIVQKLLFLAQAYLINDPQNTLFQNQRLKEVITIIMDDFAKNYYFEGQQQFVNWWFYEIGIPRDLTRLLGVLTKVYKTELNADATRVEYEQKFKNWSAGINYFLPNARYGGAARTAILNFVPVTSKRSQTGANVIDTAKPIIAAGILTNNINQVQDAILAMYDNLFRDYVQSKDGFYRDGSFIQHGNIAYVGSYGEVLYTGIADMFKYFENSVLDLSKDARFEKIYQFTELAVMPFMFKMSIQDGLSGRSIVREGYSDKQKGMNILGALTIILKNAPEKYKARLNNFILDQISSFSANQIRDFGRKYRIRDFYVENLVEFLNNPRLVEQPRTNEDWKFYETNYFDKNFESSTVSFSSEGKPNVKVGIDLVNEDNGLWFTKNQDRYVWKQKDFMFNINLRGRTVGFPEATLGENLESYYQSDGTTLLHTSNNNEPYANDYWTVMNPELTPGTSSSHTNQFDPIYNYIYPDQLGPDPSKWTDEKAKSDYDKFIKGLQDKRKNIEDRISLSTNRSFNNGIVFDNMGYVKAQVLSWNSNLTTRKAYFMIGEQIIIIGSLAPVSQTANKVTTIENRLPKDPSKASFTETGVKINNKDAQKFVYSDTENNEKNAYFVFENKATAEDKIEQKYAVIANSNRNLTREKDRISRTFKTLTINQNNSNHFAYSIVPNYEESKEQQYLDVLNNFKILVSNGDYIIASYTKDVDGKKVTTYFISSFLEPNPSRQAKDRNGNPIGEDEDYEKRVEKGVFVPGLDVTINLRLPTTLIIQKEENSKVWKGVSSSDSNLRNYEIYFDKNFVNFKAKNVLNEKIDRAEKKNFEASLVRRSSKKAGIAFYNSVGLENNIKHNIWFEMEEE